MKLLISRDLPQRNLDLAAARFEMTLREVDAPMTRAECQAALSDYDIVLPTLGDAFGAETFEGLGEGLADVRCKLLANFGVGYNHIHVPSAQAAGIAVTNTPGAVTDATADIAMTLILTTARRAGEGERMLRAGNWTGWAPTQMLGLHMSGKRVGIVGLGRIGQAIARRCHFGFGMAVSYVSRSDKDVPFDVERASDLEALAAAVDFLVVAVPGGADTRLMIGAQVFDAMSPHAHLINIARGDVVDDALRGGRIGGAGLDVYEFEPRVPEALLGLENVTLLPHLGTAALEVRTDMGRMAVANIAAFLKGDPLPNPV